MKNASADALKEYEEERRLFYVGTTRAKNELSLFTFGAGRSTFSDELFEKKQASLTASKTGKSASEASFSQKDYGNFCASFCKGTELCHKMFGKGKVISCESDIINVIFDNGSVKKLSLRFLYERMLLQ
jgi:DNA helicase-2/ATP-dependent DNA helicase PcrA